MKITYCVALKNRWANLQYLLASLANLQNPREMELVVSDFGSTDVDLAAVLKSACYPGRLGLTHSSFNRSAGLNAAVRNSPGAATDLVCFLDADMWLPVDFADAVRAYTRLGECYFPICYSLHADKPREVLGDEPPRHGSRGHVPAANGWWRKEGQGICAFTRADFMLLGGWNEEIGRTYGREDNDLFRRAGKLLQRHRARCPGLFHLWHPINKSWEGL